MSKGYLKTNEAIKLNSGRVGNIRYYTKAGKTYSRTTSRTGGSTRTLAQMAYRCRLANIKNHYTFMSGILKKCFESADAATSTYNLFTGRSAKCDPVFLTKEQKLMGYCIAAPYCISEGSLPPISYALNSNGILQSGIAIGSLSIGDDTTVGELAEAIVENNDTFKFDDYVSFVAVKQTTNSGVPGIKVDAYNIKLVKNSSELLADKADDGFASEGGCLAMADEPELGCYGWIHSRKKSGVQVSTQYLYNANSALVGQYGSDEQLELAAESYGNIGDEVFITSDDGEGGDTPGPTPSTGKTITVNVADYCSTMGKVQINDGPMDNTEKSLEVEPGTQVTIKAAPVSGYQFCNWSDGDSNATRTITVNDDCEFTAEFEES